MGLQPRVDQLWHFVNSLKVAFLKKDGQHFFATWNNSHYINIVLLDRGHPSHITSHNGYGHAFSKNNNACVNCKPHLLHFEISLNSNFG